MDLEDARSDLINDLMQAEAYGRDYMQASVKGLRVVLQELARLERLKDDGLPTAEDVRGLFNER